jgi:Outer membrane protein beta-barrel domain
MSPKTARQRVILPLFMIALATAAVPAAAQDRRFHVEADLGRVSVNDIDGVPIDDSTMAFRLGTGYRLLDWLGVSGAYVDLGTIESSVDTGTGAPLSVEASASGFELTLSGHIPLTDALALTADTGVLWWTGDTNVGGTSSHDNGNDFTWGVGAEYAFGPSLALSAGWRRYKVEEVDADSIWLGMVLRFGDAR